MQKSMSLKYKPASEPLTDYVAQPPKMPLWPAAALEATQGQMDVYLSQLPYKCYLEEVASVGD